MFSSSALFKDFQCNSHVFFYSRTDCINNTNPFQRFFSDLPSSKHELLKSYLFSKKTIENSLSFTDVSSCLFYTSWLNDNTIVYFLAYLQKSDTDVMSLSTYFVTNKTSNNFYLQFTTRHLFNKKIIYIQVSKNENYWLLIAILLHYQTIISIDSLSFDNKKIVQFVILFFRTYATLHKIDFKAQNWNFFHHLGTQRQENLLDCGVLTLINGYVKANNSFTIESETVGVKWRYFVLDRWFTVTLAYINVQSSKFNKDSVEAAQASYQSKKHDNFSVKGVISYKTLQALMNSASNTNTNNEKSNSNHVFNLSSSEEESDN